MTIKSYVSRFFIFVFAVSVFFLGSCRNSGSDIPDVSKVPVTLNTSRFDLDLYAIDTNHIANGLIALQKKYPDFLNYYLDTVMAYEIKGNFNDTVKGIREGLRPFLTFKDFKGLEDSIKAHYPDSKATDAALLDGFRYMKYYFPAYHIPRIMYVNMGLSNWPSFPLDTNTLCIGLDMFLGDQFPHYKAIGVPAYMLSHCRSTYIPVSLFSVIYKALHPFKTDDRPLIDLMIQRGKEQYFLHKILPHAPDSVLFGFTAIQLAWCNENEALVYNFFIHQNLLFSKEVHNILPYINDGPFAKDLEDPRDTVKVSPGNIGTWMGYRIVMAYMSRHPNTTLPQLLELHIDPARLLDEARYHPKE